MYSDDQIEKMLLSDLGIEERKLARQGALAGQLRNMGLQGGGRKDWASQLSQGLAGIGSAVATNRLPGQEAEFAQQKAQRIRDIWGMKPPVAPGTAGRPLTGATMPEMTDDERMGNFGY